MKARIRSIILALAMVSPPALAAGDPADTAAPAGDPVLERYAEASARKDWARAAGIANEGIAQSPRNANYHNLYAYALRNGAKPPMDLVFRHYNEALRLDPKHRGAHEYLGEAYLMVDNLAKAKEHLAALDRLCTFGCDEFSKLKKAVAAREARRK